MRPLSIDPSSRFRATMETLEDRRLLAAMLPGLLDPVLVPKYVNAMPNALDPSFVWQPVSGNQYDIGVYPITQDLGLGTNLAGQPILTNLYGYGSSAATATYPGRSFIVQKDQAIDVNWRNELWDANTGMPLSLDQFVVKTFVPDGLGGQKLVSAVDPSLFGHHGTHNMMPMMGIPMVTHLHGGHTESDSDGLPMQWWTPMIDPNTGMPMETGPDFVKSNYHYDNDQEAATLWYHDHAMGVTRLHAYAGIAGYYFVRDQYDTGTASNAWGLPYGNYEIPIAIQDKLFTADGQLFYQTMTAVHPGTGHKIEPSTLPEAFGDTIVVNGKAWPFLDVEPRKYRFHLLNGSDSRFYNFFLPTAAGTNLPMYMIGGDQGIMNAPVKMNSLLLGPGERADVIIDFAAVKGQTLILRNNAKGPYPKGVTADPKTTGQIMQFRVGATVTQADNPLPATLRGGVGQPAKITPLVPTTDPLTGLAKTRQLALFEGNDEYLRITPMLGTVQDGPIAFMDPSTENPMLGDTEVWEIYNTTADAHPIHLHLVKFQVVSRQAIAFSIDPITGGIVPGSLKLKGKVMPPPAFEGGYEDTVIMNPGEVTRIIATFDRPGEYVWHCHILSHEEHDMMRPIVVQEPAAAPALATALSVFGTAPVKAVEEEDNALAAVLQ